MAQALRRIPVAPSQADDRYEELKRILEARRDVLAHEVNGRLRGVRAEHEARPHGGADFGEVADTDMQDDIEFALLEMKAETLNKVREALVRLEQGRYGHCHECGDEIAEARLRALPFAVRCTPCESMRERDFLRAQAEARRVAPLFELRG
jgi:DnaK suppressor protein